MNVYDNEDDVKTHNTQQQQLTTNGYCIYKRMTAGIEHNTINTFGFLFK